MSSTRIGLYMGICPLVALLMIAQVSARDSEKPTTRGFVFGHNGKPVSGARITVMSETGPCHLLPGYSGGSWATDADGQFLVPTPSRPAVIRIDHPDQGACWARLEPSMRVVVPEPAFVECAVSEMTTLRAMHGLEEVASADGTDLLRLGPLPAEVALVVTAEAPGCSPAQTELHLSPGETRTVTLRPQRGKSIQGRIVPARSGIVIRANQGNGREGRAVTSHDGTFEISGLTEGRVRVVVLGPGDTVRTTVGNVGEFLQIAGE